MVLFWAHHEKLVVVDRKIGFMGGLDLCKTPVPVPSCAPTLPNLYVCH